MGRAVSPQGVADFKHIDLSIQARESVALLRELDAHEAKLWTELQRTRAARMRAVGQVDVSVLALSMAGPMQVSA